jgi:hypothetical protein
VWQMKSRKVIKHVSHMSGLFCRIKSSVICFSSVSVFIWLSGSLLHAHKTSGFGWGTFVFVDTRFTVCCLGYVMVRQDCNW